MKLDITGRWGGEYVYGEGYPAGLAPVAFTLELRQGWCGWFRGSVQDDPVHGMPDPGVVRGRVSRVQIAFIKSMPNSYVFAHDGTTTSLRSQLQRTSGLDPGPIAHPPLQYVGHHEPATGSFRGEWRIDDGAAQGRGTWWMARKP